MAKLEARIISALRYRDLSGLQLADELFIDRKTARTALARMVSAGLLKRKFRHNKARNSPDYLYSVVGFIRKQTKTEHRHLLNIVGDVDAIDFKQVKE